MKMTTKLTWKKFAGSKFIIFFSLLGLSLLIYGSSLSNTFFADDFEVMKRLVIDKQFWVSGFFRPLSDITLLLCYWIGGLNAWVQYLFNIIFFAGCAFLIFLFCEAYFKNARHRRTIAILAAVLFVVY